MMPNTSVRPAASRNSVTPSCSPFSVCSAMRIRFTNEKGAPGAPSMLATPLPLHFAGRAVGVLVVLEHGLLDFHHRVGGRRGARHRLQQVEVLDREVVLA